jgi:hypothetical protein
MIAKELVIEISIDGNSIYRKFKLEDSHKIATVDWNPTIISMADTIEESCKYPF